MTRTHRRAAAHSFTDLVNRPFRDGDGVNAFHWSRTLDGDFAEVARLLAPPDGLVTVEPDHLRSLALSPAGQIAAAIMLDDYHRLEALGHAPVLNCITRYPRDDRGLALVTDVMSFHVDRAPVEVDTWLCTYFGKSSEGLDNDDARRLIDSPAIRAALLQAYGGPDDDAFAEYLRDNSFDLHYAPVENAKPFAFGVGALWRIAVMWPGCPVPPCIHRAPPTEAGDAPRLLLIC